jgi:hypothetical protein
MEMHGRGTACRRSIYTGVPRSDRIAGDVRRARVRTADERAVPSDRSLRANTPNSY